MVTVEPIQEPDGSDIVGREREKMDDGEISAQGRGRSYASVAKSKAGAGRQEGASENGVCRPLAPLNL